MEEALRALIASDAGVTSIAPAASITWELRKGLPAVVMHLITGPNVDMTQDGPSGLMTSTVQVNCVGSTAAESLDLSRKVRAVVAGHNGGTVLHLVTVEGGGADAERGEGPVDGAKPANFHTRRLDLRVRHYDP